MVGAKGIKINAEFQTLLASGEQHSMPLELQAQPELADALARRSSIITAASGSGKDLETEAEFRSVFLSTAGSMLGHAGSISQEPHDPTDNSLITARFSAASPSTARSKTPPDHLQTSSGKHGGKPAASRAASEREPERTQSAEHILQKHIASAERPRTSDGSEAKDAAVADQDSPSISGESRTFVELGEEIEMKIRKVRWFPSETVLGNVLTSTIRCCGILTQRNRNFRLAGWHRKHQT